MKWKLPKATLNNIQIPNSHKNKFLGLTFDKCLT